jgi:acid stress-induced BolA-like protein IbaG/YrbA
MFARMAITAEAIRTCILAALPDAEVTVRGHHRDRRPLRRDRRHPAVPGRLPVDRHRMIYAALGDAMRSDIHALALETLTPTEQQRETDRRKDGQTMSNLLKTSSNASRRPSPRTASCCS